MENVLHRRIFIYVSYCFFISQPAALTFYVRLVVYKKQSDVTSNLNPLYKLRVFCLKNTGKNAPHFWSDFRGIFSKEIVMTDRVIIFDTTLRDGEQALKASLTVKENCRSL